MKTRFEKIYNIIMESTKPSKKFTPKKVIKEDIGDDEDDEGEGLTTDEWLSNNYDKACAAVDDEMALATIKYDGDNLYKTVMGYFEEFTPEYFHEWLQEEGITEEEAFQQLIEEITEEGSEGGLDDADWDSMYNDKQDCFNRLAEEIKASPENMEAFKLALIEWVIDEPEQSAYNIDCALMNTSKWEKYGFTFSNELKQQIETYRDYQGWMYERYFAADDYCDWEYPEDLVEELGLNEYWEYLTDLICGTRWHRTNDLAKAKEIEKQHPEFEKYGEKALEMEYE